MPTKIVEMIQNELFDCGFKMGGTEIVAPMVLSQSTIMHASVMYDAQVDGRPSAE